MRLSGAERRWLSWFGKTGKLAMFWSCFLNRHRYGIVEKTFDGIANTRHKLLMQWAGNQWEFLGNLAATLSENFPSFPHGLLQEKKKQAQDFSELFVIDTHGKVLASTYKAREGTCDLPPKAVAEGLKAAFLHGPYIDQVTESIGPSTSKFHDEVTLMFYQPIARNGETVGCLCGRVPNDVMSDLIQREQGHIYRESGDNYVFMVAPRFDHNIQPGTALSRSRFEDDAFTHGDNLKKGVKTNFGVVRVERHTELELRFTDPASKELHPGVRETIAKGENLFVTYPGYPDYRHIPVIGKGITFQLPGSPDRWGMMCEGDLEEVYRQRSIGYRLMRLFLLIAGLLWGTHAALAAWLEPGVISTPALTGGMLAAGWGIFYFAGVRQFSQRLMGQSGFFLTVAECGGTLKMRLEHEHLVDDETGDLGRWINSFIDKVDDTVHQVMNVAGMLAHASSDMSSSSAMVADGSAQQSEAAATTAAAVEQMMVSTDHVAEQATETRNISQGGSELSLAGKHIVQNAAEEMTKIAQTVSESSQMIMTLEQRSSEITKIVKVIKEIADQTNLLALNAAIEAARAGEQGRGFAVVADEVRKLAERTTRSTTEINHMIGAIQTETQRAVDTMRVCSEQAQQGMNLSHDAANSLEQIHSGADHTLNRVRDIAIATGEQSAAGNNIAQNVEKIAQMAEQNSAAAAHSRIVAKNLEQLAADLQKAVSKFTA